MQQLKVRFLIQRFGGSYRVGGVGNYDIELVLAIAQELKAIADVGSDAGVLQANRHGGEVFPRDADDRLGCVSPRVYIPEVLSKTMNLVNVAENGLFHAFMLHNFPQHATISATNDQDFLRTWVRVHGEVRDHLLVPIVRT